MLTIYIHPTCASSRRLILRLHEGELLDRVTLLNASEPSYLGKIIWSVPWIELDRVPLATDPVGPEEVISIIEGSSEVDVEDPLTALMEAILHSQYAAGLVYLHGSLDPILSRDFISAAVRSPITGIDPESVIAEAKNKEEELLDAWMDRFMRTLGICLVRNLWWASRRSEEVEPPSKLWVTHWLIASVGMGRVGLPSRVEVNEERMEALWRFVRRGFWTLYRKIDREQTEILNDSGYWRILDEKNLV